MPDDEDGVILRDLLADLDGTEARYVRIVARNYGTIPDWHPGHGDGAFIFIDEILIEEGEEGDVSRSGVLGTAQF